MQANAFVEWDIKTVSAADYTVEFEITDDMYEYFESKYLDKNNPLSEIGQFRQYIKNEMEMRLTEFPALHLDGEAGDMEDVKIAVITFAFDNPEIIKALRKRGKFIEKEQYDKLAKINKKLVQDLNNTVGMFGDKKLLDKL